MTHNLFEFRGATTRVEPYAREFADWVHEAVSNKAVDRLVNYRTQAPHAQRAHPTEEHFLPLLVALGAGLDADPQFIDGGITYGMLSMDSYGWGIGAAA